MNQNPEENVLDHLARGISQLTPDRADGLWDRPVVPADGSEWYLDAGQKRPPVSRKSHAFRAAAACLALCMMSVFLFQRMPSAAVYLDVNPSIRLNVNYRNRVTGAVPCNADAEEILEDLDFRGTDLDVALYAILGSMVHHGYLTQATDTVLISVTSANTSRANELELAVTDMVSQSLDTMIQAGEVLSQQIPTEDLSDSRDSATPGRDTFIEDLRDKYPQLETEHLEHLTVDEIVSRLEEEGLDYSDYKESDDDEDEDDDDDDRDDDDDDDDPGDEEDEDDD